MLADPPELLRLVPVGRCVSHRQDVVDRRPMLDNAVAIIVRRLPRRGSARNDAYSIDVDLAAGLPRQGFYALHVPHGLLKGYAVRDCREQRIAVADCKGLAGRGGAGVHDQRAGAPIGFGLRAHTFEPDEAPLEVEILTRRPSELDDVEPFLGIGVALLVIAQRGAEHFEFALVPPANEVQTEPTAPDVVGGDEF